MSNRRWVFIDTPYLCHRAFRSKKGLHYNEIPTAIVFGVMMDLMILQRELGDSSPNHYVFCFDKGRNKRLDLSGGYKANRKKEGASNPFYKNGQPTQTCKVFKSQVNALRDYQLKELGFYNVLAEDGFEADDIIAYHMKEMAKECTAVIVAEDKDFYQLLSDRVSIWKPKKKVFYTKEDFKKEFRITPKQWVIVKSLAGCKSDGVSGIPRVGEITALKFIRHELDRESKLHEAITSHEGRKIEEFNRKLIQLPFPGLEPFDLGFHSDKVTEGKWRKVCKKYGMKSIRDLFPFGDSAEAKRMVAEALRSSDYESTRLL